MTQLQIVTADLPEPPPEADEAELMRLLEAMLFAAAEPLDETSIMARMPENADVPRLLSRLEELYRARGVNLVRIAGKFALRTAPDLAPKLQLQVTVSRKLSRAAIETLAIVAYHQPVTRAEIEEIRGVALSKGTLDMLMEIGWVQPKGRRETPGRPVTWVTTEAFLSHFGLDGLADLPGMDELKAAGLLDARPAAALGETIAELPGLPDADDADADEPLAADDALLPPEDAGPEENPDGDQTRDETAR